ncbi:hypothetical protein HMPREF9104_03016 [Lentilactobacillus kisonensis F0435]|uniref:Uncharacterized protein n=2 Tax=Lentilactobacillus kisonensis TaxID=481722 RepID=H1LK70_9LACO|nr:hypothetical protein HMPREF9104_03016 [Lentilactobacillus kisonensis F0435]
MSIMMNTKKHIVNVAVAASLILGIIYLFFLVCALYKGYGNVPINISIGLWIMLAVGVILDMVILVRTGKANRRIKFFDFGENGYPLDMEHNDEREWRMMLTATYVSARLTTSYLIIVFMVPYALVLSETPLGPSFWPIFAGTALFIAIMVSEWGYVLAYLHLNKQ